MSRRSLHEDPSLIEAFGWLLLAPAMMLWCCTVGQLVKPRA